MAGHAQLKFVMTECSKTQIRFTGLNCIKVSFSNICFWICLSSKFDFEVGTSQYKTGTAHLSLLRNYVLFVCVEVLQLCQQLQSCQTGQLPTNTVPAQA